MRMLAQPGLPRRLLVPQAAGRGSCARWHLLHGSFPIIEGSIGVCIPACLSTSVGMAAEVCTRMCGRVGTGTALSLKAASRFAHLLGAQRGLAGSACGSPLWHSRLDTARPKRRSAVSAQHHSHHIVQGPANPDGRYCAWPILPGCMHTRISCVLPPEGPCSRDRGSKVFSPGHWTPLLQQLAPEPDPRHLGTTALQSDRWPSRACCAGHAQSSKQPMVLFDAQDLGAPARSTGLRGAQLREHPAGRWLQPSPAGEAGLPPQHPPRCSSG